MRRSSALSTPAARAPDSSGALNPEQLRAVQSVDGPLLILAGAGSGKTRVITCRIAHMLRQGIGQSSILGVTFTNKAAQEMAHRVRELHGRKLPSLTVCTFHAFGVKVLRQHGHLLGYRPNFSIYDESDRQNLIKEAARDLGLLRRDSGFDAYTVAGLFSRLKSETAPWDQASEELRPLYLEYQSRLRLFNSVDFDDLIILPLSLLEEREDVRSQLQQRFRYFMVDEFQDTSLQQYRLMRLLAAASRNLCVVGDDDQSIYSWRGAHFENILMFERDFPEYIEVKLEQNYRSTRKILLAANQLIRHNLARKGKKLWSGLAEGEQVTLSFPENELREGEQIAAAIRSLALKERVPLSEFGVLVRTNSLTRALEEAFVRENLLYQVSGGMSYFQRQEVKDILSYLRLVANPDDDISLLRIVNTPRRGIGKRSLEAVVEAARARECSLYSAMSALAAEGSGGGEARRGGAAGEGTTARHDRAAGVLDEFISLVEEYRRRFLGGAKLADTLSKLIEEIGYWGHLVQENPRSAIARWKLANVEGLIDSLASYEEDPDNVDPKLFDYLNRIGLLTRDNREELDGKQKVNLMTIHAAKGLEFDTVFVAGLEEGIVPHARALEEGQSNLEEERRLFYVAITRAKRRLCLSACRTRRRRGQLLEAQPSPFLDELPSDLLEIQREDQALSDAEARRLFAEMKRKLQP
jgi:DNA helicase-2/ATP-dependent DNA helicase PcrA